MRRWRVSTTALCYVHTTVEAESAEEALADAPREGGAWEVGDVCLQVELDEGETDVVEVDALGRDIAAPAQRDLPLETRR